MKYYKKARRKFIGYTCVGESFRIRDGGLIIMRGDRLQISCTLTNASTCEFLPVSHSSKPNAKCISRSYRSPPIACFCESPNCRILAIAQCSSAQISKSSVQNQLPPENGE